MSVENLPVFTEEEVASHNTKESLWLIIDGKVYDVTEFQGDHPGGPDVLLDNAGKDASVAFASIGHSQDAVELRDNKYLIGTVGTDTTTFIVPTTDQPTTTQDQSDWCCSGGSCKFLKAGGAVAVVVAVGIALFFAYKKFKK